MRTAQVQRAIAPAELVCAIPSPLYDGELVVLVELDGGLWVGHAEPGKLPADDLLEVDEERARAWLELAVREGQVHRLPTEEPLRSWCEQMLRADRRARPRAIAWVDAPQR